MHLSLNAFKANTKLYKIGIGSLFNLSNFSLKDDINVLNLAFLVGSTMLPLNNKQINNKLLVSCTINLCVFCILDCWITLPNPIFFLI